MARILLLSAPFGHGHNKAAKNIQSELERRGHTTAIADFFSVDSRHISKMVAYLHEKMVSKSPSLFGLLCELTKSPHAMELAEQLNHLNRRNAVKLIEKHKPDLVVCTHFTPLGACVGLPEKYSDLPVLGVVTDFSVHPLWMVAETAKYFVAHKEAADQLEYFGISPDRIFVTGIPVSDQFVPVERRASDLREVLVMAGGMGLDSIEAVMEGLQTCPGTLKVTFLCGENGKLRNKLIRQAKTFRHSAEILSYTDQVPALMQKADVLVTKPGGLTCSEALATSLPMILFGSLPGPEEGNARFLVESGVALPATTAKDIGRLVDRLFTDTRRYRQLVDACSWIGFPASTKQIADEIVKTPVTPASIKRLQ
ncbi:MAG: glycosyltransferase [Negativicutes bacterium]|nr:glycosyltransferase [Negativicutes bacterium]